MQAAKDKFVPGQRWSSDTEPELGLGIIREIGFREVKIEFRAAKVTRTYMHRNAPLRRVRLKAGDRARSQGGHAFVIKAVKEAGGLLTYLGDGETLPEQDLLDQMAFSDPDKRLLGGQVGKPREFALRYRTHRFRRDMLGSRVRGLAGARMELLDHQISIAHEVASRPDAKVLLADEVGLGKTIEAGLIFHRLFVTGQIGRVLVAAPSQLVHQWMVELYRRFNHMFTVVDEDLFRSEEKGDAKVNPFLNRQTMICSVDFLAASDKRVQQAAAAGLDLLIVDEAHHLAWTPEAKSKAYAAIEALAKVSRGVLLLTATPIQLGQSGHFGRLRLLDPGRFTDLAGYLAEAGRYQELAATVDRILASEAPVHEAVEAVARAFPGDQALRQKLADYAQGEPGSRSGLIDDLVDRHGTGRLMFRNRRSALGGFPKRVVHAVPLDNVPEHREWAGKVAPFRTEPELLRFLNGPAAFSTADLSGVEGDVSDFLKRAWRKDPRLDWLVQKLKELEGEKVLLICSLKNAVFALQDILPTLTTATFAAFHENLVMATRDKNAAYFAQPDGAQMLICSEIGSEGRNFQFAHHLVLFDLPLDPSVLEQRIGRLDRIGQRSDIHIHVPYIKGTAHEVLYRWYEEGMDAFQSPVLGSDYFHEEQIGEVMEACRQAVAAEVEGDSGVAPAIRPGEAPGAHLSLEANVAALVERTRSLAARVRETLEKGRDRLLEINSNRPELARALIAEIRAEDVDGELEEYLEEIFDHFGVDSENTDAKRGYFLFPGDRMEVDSFPNLPPTGLAVTYDRGEALAREDLAFLTLDHPMVRGVVDLVLGSSEGTVGFVEWREAPRTGDGPVRGFALDVVFVLEATAPGYLHLDRFLAPSPIRVMVDAAGEDISGLLPRMDIAELEQAPTGLLEEHHDQFDRLVPKLLEAAIRQAGFKESAIKKEAHKEAEKRLGAERDRLRDLKAVNPSVKAADVEAAEKLLKDVTGHIMAAELRVDAVRLVILGRMQVGSTSA